MYLMCPSKRLLGNIFIKTLDFKMSKNLIDLSTKFVRNYSIFLYVVIRKGIVNSALLVRSFLPSHYISRWYHHCKKSFVRASLSIICKDPRHKYIAYIVDDKQRFFANKENLGKEKDAKKAKKIIP